MGRRGPAPAPTAVRLKRGEQHRDRLNFREPRPLRSAPQMPRDMDPTATAVWRRVVREQAPGVIRAVDADVLRAYCESVSRYVQASRLLSGSAPLIKGARHGDLITNPLHRVCRDNADAIRLFARELGLSPSARAGLHMEISPHFLDAQEEMNRLLGPARGLRMVGERAASDEY
jgi:P27 family predicted phage terminase small subunit